MRCSICRATLRNGDEPCWSCGAEFPLKSERWLCPQCHTRGTPAKFVKGSFLVELGLWMAGVVGLLFPFVGLPMLLIALLYSLWRVGSKYKACRECGATGMIPITSPRARELLKAEAVGESLV